MRQFLKTFNFNSVFILLVSGFLCYMQTKVLQGVDLIPVLQQQIQTFKEQLSEMREEIKQERRERESADRENQQRMRLIEDVQARRP